MNDDPRHLVDRIQIIREKNNGNWMEILKIALRHAPDETKPVLYRILAADEAVSHEMRQLLESK